MNPGKFSIPCSLSNLELDDALCDSSLSVNVISLKMVKALKVTELKENTHSLTSVDATSKCPLGVLSDYPLKIGNCIVPTNFMVMEIELSKGLPFILGTPFLATTRDSMDFHNIKAILYNVDPYTSYSISPSQANVCGIISSGNYFGEMMIIEASEEVIQDEKKTLQVYDTNNGLDLFDGVSIGLLYEEK